MAAIARLERLWLDDGAGDYRTEAPRGLGQLVARLAARRALDIRTGWAVARVERIPADGGGGGGGRGRLLVSSHDGRSVKASAAIVAVPVTVLQRRHNGEQPPLPLDQQRSIDSIRVAPACKVLLSFASPPWPTAARPATPSTSSSPLYRATAGPDRPRIPASTCIDAQMRSPR